MSDGREGKKVDRDELAGYARAAEGCARASAYARRELGEAEIIGVDSFQMDYLVKANYNAGIAARDAWMDLYDAISCLPDGEL